MFKKDMSQRGRILRIKRAIGSVGAVVLGCVLLAGCQYRQDFSLAALSEIKIRDHKTHHECTIDQSEHLDEISSLWRKSEVVEQPPEVDWSYSLDITDIKGSTGGRWLFSKDGYIVRLTYTLRPVYRIPNFEQFRLLVLNCDRSEPAAETSAEQ